MKASKPRVRPELTIRHATFAPFPTPFLSTPDLALLLEKGGRAKRVEEGRIKGK